MKNYMKKKGILANEFPEFPPKRIFNKGEDFVKRRIAKLNQYFALLYTKFSQKIPYTNAIIDLC
jgi:hypothetical protein